jgi:S-(hydroxymethyl)glutathione dehydrogenase/alcohol dehydrogenase
VFDFSRTFRAAVLRQSRAPLTVIDVHPPKLRSDEALVSVEYAGVCRSQVMEIDGSRGRDEWLPHMLGHEAVGKVIKVGDETYKEILGRRAVLSWIRNPTDVVSNRQYLSKDGSIINAGDVTTFSEYTVVPVRRLHLLSSELDSRILTLFGCALVTGAGMVARHFEQDKQNSCLIVGFGGIGSSAALMSTYLFGQEPTIIDTSHDRRTLAKKLGFKKVYSPTSPELADNKFDICFEAGGSIESIEFAFSKLTSNGRLVFASHPAFSKKLKIDPYELIRGKQIFGTWGGEIFETQQLQGILDSVQKSNFDLEMLIGEEFTLENVNSAIDAARSATSGRILLRMK